MFSFCKLTNHRKDLQSIEDSLLLILLLARYKWVSLKQWVDHMYIKIVTFLLILLFLSSTSFFLEKRKKDKWSNLPSTPSLPEKSSCLLLFWCWNVYVDNNLNQICTLFVQKRCKFNAFSVKKLGLELHLLIVLYQPLSTKKAPLHCWCPIAHRLCISEKHVRMLWWWQTSEPILCACV